MFNNVILEDGCLKMTNAGVWISIKTEMIPDQIDAMVNINTFEKAIKGKGLKEIYMRDDTLYFEGNMTKQVYGGNTNSVFTYPLTEKVSEKKLGKITIDNQYGIADYASSDEARLSLCHVSYSAEEQQIRATDGHRAIYTSFKGCTLTEDILIPAKLHKVLEGEFDVTSTKLYRILRNEDITVLIRFEESLTYPAFKKIIPQDNHIEYEVNRLELASALKEIAPFVNKRTCLIKCTVGKGEIKLSLTNKENAVKCDKTISAVTGKMDEPFVIGFNVKLMLKAVLDLDTDRILFKSRTQISATTVHAICDKPDLLLMPLKIFDD